MQSQGINWAEVEAIGAIFGGLGAAALGVILTVLFQNRKEVRERHQENQDSDRRKWNLILEERKYHPPHSHAEDCEGALPGTPLTVGGLRFPPKNGNS